MEREEEHSLSAAGLGRRRRRAGGRASGIIAPAALAEVRLLAFGHSREHFAAEGVEAELSVAVNTTGGHPNGDGERVSQRRGGKCSGEDLVGLTSSNRRGCEPARLVCCALTCKSGNV